MVGVIPTYNNVSTVADVIRGAREHLSEVIVVDDGSTDGSGAAVRGIEGVEVIVHPRNMGKGDALRAGFARAQQRGFTHALTIDADGQHLARDIPSLLQRAAEEPETLWIGNRVLPAGGSEQPGRSRFGARFGAFWYRFHTGITIHDTQCGLRVYPLAVVEEAHSRAERYGYELEVLIKVAWNGHSVKETPVHIYYEPSERRVSHFKPAGDFARLSVINSKAALTRIFLPWRTMQVPGTTTWQKIRGMVMRELLAHHSPRRAAAAIALGACMALMPIHGLQVITLMALCVGLRLNKALAFAGVSISSAPFLPFWIAVQYALGRLVLPDAAVAALGSLVSGAGLEWLVRRVGSHAAASSMATGFVQWVVGSVLLALAVGLVLYFSIYPLLVHLDRLRGRNVAGRTA